MANSLMVAGRFSKELEARAREISEETSAAGWNDSLEGIVAREVALVVNSIDREREMTRDADRRLLRLGMYVSTDIMNLVPGGRYYFDPNIDRRGRLKRQLGEIERERVKIRIDSERRLSELQRGLLEAIEQHSQLISENGYTQNVGKTRATHSRTSE